MSNYDDVPLLKSFPSHIPKVKTHTPTVYNFWQLLMIPSVPVIDSALSYCKGTARYEYSSLLTPSGCNLPRKST
jgi:hypothetical protein